MDITNNFLFDACCRHVETIFTADGGTAAVIIMCITAVMEHEEATYSKTRKLSTGLHL